MASWDHEDLKSSSAKREDAPVLRRDEQHRRITERDMRAPEFRDCEPEDLEWRDDGTLARKDRWERGIREIASVVGLDPRKSFEVADVVAEVRRLKAVEPRRGRDNA